MAPILMLLAINEQLGTEYNTKDLTVRIDAAGVNFRTDRSVLARETPREREEIARSN